MVIYLILVPEPLPFCAAHKFGQFLVTHAELTIRLVSEEIQDSQIEFNAT